MPLDRNAIIKEAQKLAGKGQYDKAIAEWRKLVKEDPNDATTFNTIGDLCLKKNSKSEAVDAYKRAADILAEDGFTSKAIALYKKVLNIDPAKFDVHLALGDLNAEKGMTGSALESYKIVADHYKKQNKTAAALGIYQKMADLNPSNVAFRVKLAEMYVKEGMKKEAVNAYLAAADVHISKEAYTEARQMFEKVLAADPANKQVYHKAGIVYFKEGKFVEACKALKPAFEADPENQELIDLYLDSLAKAGRTGDAEDVYLKVLARDPARIDLHEKLYEIAVSKKEFDKALKEAVALADHKAESMDFGGAAEILRNVITLSHDPLSAAAALADLFDRKGRARDGALELVKAADELIGRGSSDDAHEVLSRALLLSPGLEEAKKKLDELGGAAPAAEEVAGAPPAEEPSIEIPPAPQAPPPPPPAAAAPPAPAEAPAEEEAPQVAEALAEVDVLMKYGLADKALERLEGIVRTSPDSASARGRLLDLYRSQKKTDKAVIQALMLAELHEKKGRKDESASVLRAALELAPGNPQIMAKLGMPAAAPSAPAPEAPEPIETIEELETLEMPEEAAPEIPDLGMPEVPAAPAEELELPEEPEELAMPETTVEPPAAPAEEAYEELSLEEEAAPSPPRIPRAAKGYQPPEPEMFEEEFGAEAAVGPQPLSDEELAETWSEAEFYYQQGLFDEARKYYERIIEARPDDKKAMERIVELSREKEEVQEFSRLAEAVEGLESIVAAPEKAEESVTAADVDAVRSLMQEISDMRKAGPESKPEPEFVEEPSPPEPKATEEESFADLANEMRREAAPRAIQPAAEESFADLAEDLSGAASAAPAAPASEAPEGGGASDFFDLAAELKDELNTGAIAKPSAAAAHEQSLDEIFEEFKKGVEDHEKKEDEDTHYNLGVAYREMGLFDDAISEFNMTNEGEPKFIESRYMLGLCYLEKDDFETAITEIQNALGYSYSLGEESVDRIGMHYDLGLAYQGVGNTKAALEEFQKVKNLDPDYREVATKIKELQQGEFISLDSIKEDIEKEVSFKFLEENARIEREEKNKKTRK